MKNNNEEKMTKRQKVTALGGAGALLGGTVLKPSGGSLKSRLTGGAIVGGIGAVLGTSS